MSELHLIFTEEHVLVSRRAYASWREIQAEYADYKASLGPWSEETTVSWLGSEYGSRSLGAAASRDVVVQRGRSSTCHFPSVKIFWMAESTQRGDQP